MSDPERDLREALRSRAAAVPLGWADEAGLGRRLVAAQRRRRAKVGAVALALLVVAGSASVLAREDGQGPRVVAGPDTSSTTTSLEPSTTTTEVGPAPIDTVPAVPVTTEAPPAIPAPPGPTASSAPGTAAPRTTTTAAPLPAVPDDALWPPPGSRTTFASPEKAADDFARRFLGMGTPQIGVGKVTGTSAAVAVRPLPRATAESIVSLRLVEGRGWVVVGCAAPSIQVDTPTSGTRISSPLTVRGRTRAFEGHVDVQVRRDGATVPVGRSFGTGASDQLAPFEATVTFAPQTVPRGAVVVSEPRADDGGQGPLVATVIRVAF